MSLTDRARSAERLTGVRESVQTLNPGYFALVMGTAIVSIAMQSHGACALSVALLVLACVSYLVLLGLNAARLIAFRADFAADLADPSRAFGLFTFVAANDVVGVRLAVDAHYGPALALLVVGCSTWVALGCIVPWTVLFRRARQPESPPLEGANGTWFIWVVASQSVAVLAATLEPISETGRRELALLAVFCWSVGVFLYGATGVFVAARMLLYPLRPEDLTPPYWVAMGATAITVLAGARIVEMADTPMVTATRGLIAGTSVVFWAFGSWLVPTLVAASIWKHLIRRIPLRYEATLWSVVFPLGMYGVGGDHLGKADHLPMVEMIGANESWIGLAVWVITFFAMLHHLVTNVDARTGISSEAASTQPAVRAAPWPGSH